MGGLVGGGLYGSGMDLAQITSLVGQADWNAFAMVRLSHRPGRTQTSSGRPSA